MKNHRSTDYSVGLAQARPNKCDVECEKGHLTQKRINVI